MKLTLPKLKLPTLRKTKVSLSVQITDRVLRMLDLNEEKKPIFDLEVRWEGKSESEKLSILKTYVERYNLKDRAVISCLPVNDGLLKFYKYPATMSQKDLKHAIDWAVKRELSMIKEGTLHDYFVLEREKDAKNVVMLLVLAREEAVNNLKKLIESAGMRLKILDYEVITIINYGLYNKVAIPFSVLYIDYGYVLLVTYSPLNVAYFVTPWDYTEYLKTKDEHYLENFFAEVRNILIINDLTNIYIAGPILSEEELLTRILENLPILGLLDIEGLKPNFFIPYTLSLRGMEG
ncbi:pilus assembly protein PilM [Hydrogenobacter hydrogenophilus]|uniref:Type IV pilus assembly protein PilM n=1 Tax=Hydrogenobacter hydrogenophilus TaxID=35835 RepID=A0A285NZR1_9AQUI|nr:pilus assembly protein PilM [Hydrogenobacter hydrogenophilus]SNZ14982.1 type IV pilus assembly protein PilM [Hydrogenobacter hydrogenophilus]